MTKTAFITGITGQDGAYLAKLLIEKGYKVIGGKRRTSFGEGHNWRLQELEILEKVELVYCDLFDITNIIRIIDKYKIDEFYNLAAQSFVECSFEQPAYTSYTDYIGVLNCLEALRTVNSNIKFYQASSSEMYGKIQHHKQSEQTPFYPRSPYAVSKLAAHWVTVNYREAYNMFAVSGILFNHESPIRGEEFVTRKISKGLAKIKYGHQEYLELGNLNSKRDWGFAGDYVEGMFLMLQHKKPEDFVLATGESYSVREFIEVACSLVGYDIAWVGSHQHEEGVDKNSNKVIIKVNPNLYRPTEVDILLGDATKATTALNWKPKVAFKQLVEMMVEADLKRMERC